MDRDEQVKNTDTLFNIYKQHSNLSIKDSKAAAYVLEKTLRISAAILKLTSFIDTQSPVREDIEKTAMGLVKDAAALAHSDQSRRSFGSGIAALSALLTTATLAGILSPKNTSILNDELAALINTAAHMGTLGGRVYMDANTYAVELPQELFMAEHKTMTQSYKGQQTDTVRTQRTNQSMQPSERSYQTATPNNSASVVRYADRVQEVQKDRRATILGLLQRKDRITVKDVSNVIRDCSEKTLQRELAALVIQGVLKREGERRWSTYSLI